MKRNKTLLTILAIFLLAVVVLFLLRLFSGPEDTWLCTEQGRVKHGHPFVDKPLTGCEMRE